MPTRKKASGPAFTVEFPHSLDARKDGDAWWCDVGGRELRLSNLNKLFWPDEGYTKGDLVAFYFNIADLILPHLDGAYNLAPVRFHLYEVRQALQPRRAAIAASSY